MRRATAYADDVKVLRIISIHALRAEGDGQPGRCHERDNISIHALRAEGDLFASQGPGNGIQFLSTPSVRRATNVLNMW